MHNIQKHSLSKFFKALSFGTVVAASAPSIAAAQQHNFNTSPNNMVLPPSYAPVNDTTFDMRGLFRNHTTTPSNNNTDATIGLPGPRPYISNNWYRNLTADQSYLMAEQTIGIPSDLLRRIVFNESKGDPSATNPMSGACGLGQLMPETTLPEMFYKYRDTFGFNSNIPLEIYEGRRRNGVTYTGYRTTPDQKETLISECHDEWTNVALFSMNIIEKMRRVEAELARRNVVINDFNQADLYIAHFLGARADLMLAYRNQPNMPARDFVNRVTISQNQPVFLFPNRRSRSVEQLYEYIGQQGNGPDKNTRIEKFWDTDTTIISSRVEQYAQAYLKNNNNHASVTVAAAPV